MIEWEGFTDPVTGLPCPVEAAIDRHGEEHHELSGRAKDLGSAAVFVCLLASAVSWLAIAFQNLRGESMT